MENAIERLGKHCDHLVSHLFTYLLFVSGQAMSSGLPVSDLDEILILLEPWNIYRNFNFT